MLRPRLLRIGQSVRSIRRSLHSMPTINPSFHERGVPRFLSADGFNMAWIQHQGAMLQKLNMLTAGGEDESKDLKHIILKHAREPNQAPLFNYASMAHNNHFFFQSLLCLEGEQDRQPEMDSGLKRELEQSFGSIETLQETMVLTANAMFGPGFVWLCLGPGTQYSILCTYLAGSPYAGAHYRRQAVDMNTEDKSAADAYRRMASQPPVNPVGSFGRRSEDPLKAPGGVDLTPVLCLNMWPQAYLADYGTGFEGPGPMQYAQNWWNVIDWKMVTDRSDVKNRSFKT